MSKADKLLQKLLRDPRPKDFTWDELVTVMTGHRFTFHRATGGGSSCKFIHQSGYPFMAHEPHPENTLKPYVIKNAIQALKETGELNDA